MVPECEVLAMQAHAHTYLGISGLIRKHCGNTEGGQRVVDFSHRHNCGTTNSCWTQSGLEIGCGAEDLTAAAVWAVLQIDLQDPASVQTRLYGSDVATRTRLSRLAQRGICALALRLRGVRRPLDPSALQRAISVSSSRVTAASAARTNSRKRAAAELTGRALRLTIP